MKRPPSLRKPEHAPHGGSLVLSEREIAWQRYALALELGQELLERQLIDARAEALLWRMQMEQILNQAKGECESK